MEKIPPQNLTSCTKVVLFGPESSGKTTLAKQLASYYKTQWVPEYMRLYLEEKWKKHQQKISYSDIIPIVKGQINLENKILKTANNLVFCDTNVLELKVYTSYYYENKIPKELDKIVNAYTYDYYFLTGIDVPWEKDELRDRPYDRFTLFCMFEECLKTQNIPYTLLEGDKETRLLTAIKTINSFIK